MTKNNSAAFTPIFSLSYLKKRLTDVEDGCEYEYALADDWQGVVIQA